MRCGKVTKNKVKPVDVEFAELWLADLQDRLEGKTDEGAQQLALSQFFTLNEARNRWDQRAGKFEHAVAVLAIDRAVPITRKAGLAATFINLSIPGIKSGAGSVWARVLTAVWANEIDIREVQRLGIYESLDASQVPLSRAHVSPIPLGRRDGDLRRGKPLVWAAQ